MYQQPTHGPAVPPIVRHIFLAKPHNAPQNASNGPAPRGILAELAAQRCH